MSASDALSIRRISVDAGGTRILSHVSATLYPGEMCALLGPSGAGKSTFIKVLLGLRERSEGDATLGAHPVGKAGPLGYVPQDDALHRTLTVERELLYATRLRLPDATEEMRRERIDTVLDQVGLTERRHLRIGKLSGGQRKRVSVALELLTSPALLILDEPTSGLDPGLEARMMALFSQVAKSGRSVIVATHAMESLDLCDVLLLLVRGHLAFLGRPKDALSFFRVERYAEIFRVLEKQDGAGWARTYQAHPLKRSFDERPPPVVKAMASGTTSNASSPPARAPRAEVAPPDTERALAELKSRLRRGDA